MLHLDSSESAVGGEQESASYNWCFKFVCYHPLFCFNQLGDCEDALLRLAHVHSAEHWKQLLEQIYYVEFAGQCRKRVIIKVMGE